VKTVLHGIHGGLPGFVWSKWWERVVGASGAEKSPVWRCCLMTASCDKTRDPRTGPELFEVNPAVTTLVNRLRATIAVKGVADEAAQTPSQRISCTLHDNQSPAGFE